jgi:SCY1-like protein 1
MSAANSAVSSPTFPPQTRLNGSTPRARALQLGANKVPAGLAAASLAQQLADEAAAEDGIESNPWGNDDLMDVNADENDWSELFFFSPLSWT